MKNLLLVWAVINYPSEYIKLLLCTLLCTPVA